MFLRLKLYWFPRHWRISHAISHHLFPNTHHDLEISNFEPLMQFLPRTDKTKMFGIMSVIYSPVLVYPSVYVVETIKRYFCFLENELGDLHLFFLLILCKYILLHFLSSSHRWRLQVFQVSIYHSVCLNPLFIVTP